MLRNTDTRIFINTIRLMWSNLRVIIKLLQSTNKGNTVSKLRFKTEEHEIDNRFQITSASKFSVRYLFKNMLWRILIFHIFGVDKTYITYLSFKGIAFKVNILWKKHQIYYFCDILYIWASYWLREKSNNTSLSSVFSSSKKYFTNSKTSYALIEEKKNKIANANAHCKKYWCTIQKMVVTQMSPKIV